jgi:quercetin dioxygenase-like cupin family protein
MAAEVVDVRALVAQEATTDRVVLWSTEGQLQANLVRLAPGIRIDAHAENVLDVIVTLLAGELELTADGERSVVTAPAVVVLPAGTRRELLAGRDGATYLTTHRRRDGFLPTPR